MIHVEDEICDMIVNSVRSTGFDSLGMLDQVTLAFEWSA